MENSANIYMPKPAAVYAAAQTLNGTAVHTPLQLNTQLSRQFQCNIYLKREDLQVVRSYKLRGAFNKMATLTTEELAHSVVCASAGNHAQGVAFSCSKLSVKGTIFMPVTTPVQKVEQVRMFGGSWVNVVLSGNTFDESQSAAIDFCQQEGACFIHPFDDPKIIEGQATIALEILEDAPQPIDYLFIPVGGGGLAAGLSAMFKLRSPGTIIIGVEPAGAASMSASIKNGFNTTLPYVDKFVDGASVQRVGEYTFSVCRSTLDKMITVDEGRICQIMLELYNKSALVVEPAGALSIAGLDRFSKDLTGKNVVCIISGGNNDIARMEEIKERALMYGRFRHYFIVKFTQQPGALRKFVNDVLGPDDDITYFGYTKKNSREKGHAVIGIEIKAPCDFEKLVFNMQQNGFYVEYLNNQEYLLNLLV